MTDYNDVGISRQLDWPRIRHLFRLGLFAALTTLIGDLLLGWGVENEALSGLPRMLSAYAASDGRILASALLGLFGLALEGLCYSAYTGCLQKALPAMPTPTAQGFSAMSSSAAAAFIFPSAPWRFWLATALRSRFC